MISYIRIGRDVKDLSRKRKLNGGGDRVSHGGKLVKERGKRYQKLVGIETHEQRRI